MKRKKFYIILVILTIISLFSFAAICNRCGAITEDKVDVAEDEAGIDEASTGNEDEETAGSEEEADETGDEEEADETGDEDNGTDAEKEAPTITLEIYEGPTYSAADDVCYWRIKAIVSGKPNPIVEFNKDDSGGAWGSKKVQVNLNDPSETFTLTATATNSEGSATDSIILEWGCEEVNHDPVIDTMHTTRHEERFYIDSECSLESHASDPDGDSLSYLWEVTGGTLDNPNSQNTTWTMPSTPGDYTVTFTVSDGRGGEATESVDRHVTSLVYDFMQGAPGAYWRTGWGIISFGGVLTDSRGFTTYRNNITLEDGVIYSRVLETHPEWVNDGWISGAFPNLSDNIHIPAGARFKAKVGFIDGLTATDGAYFRIRFYDGSSWYYISSYGGIHCANDGALNTLDIDLSSIAGKSGQVFLQVGAGATSTQDWAVWVDPKIAK